MGNRLIKRLIMQHIIYSTMIQSSCLPPRVSHLAAVDITPTVLLAKYLKLVINIFAKMEANNRLHNEEMVY